MSLNFFTNLKRFLKKKIEWSLHWSFEFIFYLFDCRKKLLKFSINHRNNLDKADLYEDPIYSLLLNVAWLI